MCRLFRVHLVPRSPVPPSSDPLSIYSTDKYLNYFHFSPIYVCMTNRQIVSPSYQNSLIITKSYLWSQYCSASKALLFSEITQLIKCLATRLSNRCQCLVTCCTCSRLSIFCCDDIILSRRLSLPYTTFFSASVRVLTTSHTQLSCFPLAVGAALSIKEEHRPHVL